MASSSRQSTFSNDRDPFRFLGSPGASIRSTNPEFNPIEDRFTTLKEVTGALRLAGLGPSNLIFAIDYTMSNMQQGQKTFNGRSLHAIQEGVLNPYQKVILYVGETLASFVVDGMIPAYGFGDVRTKDKSLFSLNGNSSCDGFTEVLECYNRITPTVRLSGPTSYAPAIRTAIEAVRTTAQYHILVIVADGQVSSEEETIEAIVEASQYPLSIIVVGVGDGPWEVMREFDDQLPQRKFDNFQFVDFHKVINDAHNPQTAFAVAALMEIPDQYSAILELGLLNRIQ